MLLFVYAHNTAVIKDSKMNIHNASSFTINADGMSTCHMHIICLVLLIVQCNFMTRIAALPKFAYCGRSIINKHYFFNDKRLARFQDVY